MLLPFKILMFFSFFFKLGNKKALAALEEGGEDGLIEYINSKMWNPEYRPLVYLPPGKGE
jgi:hypothetical protein